MVSWYYHCLFKNERFNEQLVNIVRSDLEFDDYSDIHINLPTFIEYTFTRQRHPRYSWSDFVNRWHGRKDVVYASYERLVENTSDELARIIFDLCNKKLSKDLCKMIAEKYSFKEQTGREPGEEDKSSFTRKGIAGDWVNYFSKDACIVFNQYAGEELIKLGYVQDDSWINKSVISY
nr:hypothetical protein [Candidatus Dadabacteria bacterium]